MVSYRLDSDAGRNLLINLHQFVSKELSVLSGHDGLHRGPQHLHSIFLQDAPLEEFNSWHPAKQEKKKTWIYSDA